MEDPLYSYDLRGHAELAKVLCTPVCLDGSITSNIKAGRVGGYLEAVRVHDVTKANGIPVWCGGMLETGLGRAANVALAAVPGVCRASSCRSTPRPRTRCSDRT